MGFKRKMNRSKMDQKQFKLNYKRAIKSIIKAMINKNQKKE